MQRRLKDYNMIALAWKRAKKLKVK